MLYKNLTLESFENLAQNFSKTLTSPQCVLLYGDLGSGKSTFARKVIQSLTSHNMIVPSPTFTLLQTYDTSRGPLTHFDLYRINSMDEIFELGFDDYINSHICFIEWPERLKNHLPRKAISIYIKETSTITRDVLIESSRE